MVEVHENSKNRNKVVDASIEKQKKKKENKE